ncbi:ABC-type transport auxiliary lipoprotein family protein [Basilea psittacipulmonis]|uniref:ABC-type transport auxiliary lipoprotein component domain-containing protein n=1 Tax=Basilea psittacipulmonis DSM 24701 TaxID=1072685 RepID=A0A077DE91_9BURK|nr:ABC-type transport auxiliary lipoprotein family protein [Basilea psittacipulmonis]AIL32481.1 hypothetical protein IX83_03415 [Basilea psittacipulmonis DSM 24701]
MIKKVSLLTCLMLSACSLYDKLPAASVYDLSKTVYATKEVKTYHPYSLIINRPNMSKFLDSNNIIVQKDTQMMVLADGKWADSAADLIQDTVIQQLEQAKRWKAVLKASDLVYGEYNLQIQLSDFSAHLDDKAFVLTGMATLIDGKRNLPIKQTSFNFSVPFKEAQTIEMVQAAKVSVAQLSQFIIAWLEDK